MKFSLDLPCETLSVPVIRRVLGDALRGLGASEACIADLLVAASEACTNVVQHVDPSSRYEVAADIDEGRCLLRVIDQGPGFGGDPEHAAATDAESGRGLILVEALANAWDWEDLPEGKAVWARFLLPAR